MKLIVSIIKISFLINAGPVCSTQPFLKIIIICLRKDTHHRSDFLFNFFFNYCHFLCLNPTRDIFLLGYKYMWSIRVLDLDVIRDGIVIIGVKLLINKVSTNSAVPVCTSNFNKSILMSPAIIQGVDWTDTFCNSLSTLHLNSEIFWLWCRYIPATIYFFDEEETWSQRFSTLQFSQDAILKWSGSCRGRFYRGDHASPPRTKTVVTRMLSARSVYGG